MSGPLMFRSGAMRRRIPLSLAFAAAMAAASAAAAEEKNPPPSGEVVVIDSDRTFDFDLEIKAGSRLQIRAGVTMRFAAGAGILCAGVLEARGAEGKPVTFTAKDEAAGWGNVCLTGPGAEGSVLERCSFTQGRGRMAVFDKDMALAGFAKAGEKNENSLLCGGALFICKAGKVEIKACRFERNSAFWAGAVMCWGFANPSISGCLFADNKAGEDAGALQCAFDSSPSISCCVFIRNTAKWGGAIHCLFKSSPTVSHCYICDNRSEGNGGAVSCFNLSNPVFTGNIMSGNAADGERGGSVGAIVHSKPVFRGNFIAGNRDKSGEGKGLWANDSFRGQKDESSCVEETESTKDDVLKVLEEKGVLRLLPAKKEDAGEGGKKGAD